MDGFMAFWLWTVITCGIAFAGGKYFPLVDAATAIDQTGEVEIQGTIYQCKATHLVVKGKRAPL